MIHLLISTCVMAGDCDRRQTYLHRISVAFEEFRNVIPDIKVVILNNCGEENADYLYLLEDDNLQLFHTSNQLIPTTNKGLKELKDVKDYIDQNNVPDDDFIIKLTGRYLIEKHSPFLVALQNDWNENIECMIRLGDYDDRCVKSISVGDEIDCLSGLIGFKCFHYKNMPLPEEFENLEWIMAETSIQIPESRKIILDDLGINIFWKAYGV